MATIGALLIELSANTARLQQDMAQAVRIQQDAANAMNSAIETTKKAFLALGVAASAMKFVDMVRGAIDSADAMGKQAEKAGMLVEQYSALIYAGKKLDVQQDVMDTSIKKLNVSIASAVAGGETQVRMFSALGIAFKDGSGNARAVLDVMKDLATVFAGAKDDPIKIAYAVGLLGKSGAEAIPLLNKSGQAIEDLMNKAAAAGKVIDKETTEAANKFNKNLEALTNSSQKLAMSLAKDLLPDLTNTTDAMIEARKQSGLLMAAWVGLGGIANAVFSRSEEAIRNGQVERIKELEKFIAENANTANPVRQAMLGNVQREVGTLREGIYGKPRDPNAEYPIPMPVPTFSVSKTALDARGLKGEGGGGSNAADAEMRKYTNALQQEEEKLLALNGATEDERMLYKLTEGSLKDLTYAHKLEIYVLSGEVAERQAAIESMNLWAKSVQAATAVQETAAAAEQGFFSTTRTAELDLEFQRQLIGKTALEIQKLTMARKVDADERQVNVVDGADVVAIVRRAEASKKAQTEEIDRIYQIQRAWQTGASVALKKYVEDVTNSALATERLLTNAFSSAEDALVKFVQTGKLDFKSLADSIISDLIRIQVRQSITGPLAKGLGGMFGGGGPEQLSGPTDGGNWLTNLFSPRASGGPVSGGSPYLVGEKGPELFVPSSGGTVVPNGAFGGGGSVTVINNNTFNGNSDRAFIMQAVQQGGQATVATIQNMLMRNGQSGISRAMT